MKAVLNYRPAHYDGRIDVFQAEERIVRERFDPYREWAGLCDDVHLHVVPGSHLSMIHEPHVGTLAESLPARCIARRLSPRNTGGKGTGTFLQASCEECASKSGRRN